MKILENNFPVRYFTYFFVAAVIISIVALFFYNDRKKEIENETYNHVVAIKEIKLAQIEKEQLQRKRTMQALLLLPGIEKDIATIFSGEKTEEAVSRINSWADEIKKDFDFVSINIYAPDTKLLFTTDNAKNINENFLKHELQVLLSKDSSVLSNLYLDEEKNLLQAIIVPIKNQKGVLGYIWTEVSFFEYLHPILAYTRQETGDIEYILIREKSDFGFLLKDFKDGDRYLLRTLPVDKSDKQELESYIIRNRVVKEAKFRGEKIFVSVNDIPGTDWSLVAKINQSKVTQSTRTAALLTGLVSLLLILLSAVITYTIWNRSRVEFLQKTIKLRKEKESLTERYTSLTKYANDIILSADKNGKILEVNQKAVDIYGYSKEELLKMNFLDLSFDKQSDLKVVFASVNAQEGMVYETNHKRKNGTIIPVEISSKLILQDEEEILLAIIRDNTERKKLELDLILAKDKAEEMDKLKTTFLANMSHELNTPMSGIIGFSELLLAELDNENQIEMAKIIHKSSKRLNDTLNSILDLSKIESQKVDIKLSPIELITEVKECKTAFYDYVIRKGLEFNSFYSPERIVIMSDANILQKILCNLIDNAIKYTQQGSITIDVTEQNEKAVIKIADTGIGIPAENINQIFEPFRQGSEGLNRKFEGMGLGLTITKKYVEILKGKLEIESKPGHGTTVTIIFPKI